MAAHRPLTTNELREALSVIPGDASWDPARLLNNVYSALACCGCLITVDEEDDTVRMVHHSLKRFLLGQSEDSSATTPRLTEKEANIIMGEIVITYLNYGVFDTQLSSVAVPQLQHLAQTAPERVISSVRSSSYARRLALHLLQSRKKPEFNVGQVLAEAHVRFAPRPVEQYHFVSYAKQYVARHIRSVDWNQDAVRRLVFRLWANGSVANSTPEDMAIFLHMAALYGEGPAVKALLDSGANIEACDITDGSTPLTMAAATGHEAVVRLLLDSGANIEAKDTYNRTPLFRAVARGHDAVVKLLLDKGARVNLEDATRLTPLLSAAENGHVGIVELLLDRGADDRYLADERSLIHWGAEKGSAGIVKRLVDMGVNVNNTDIYGRTPLSKAAEGGQEAIVQFLLDRGADNSADGSGYTPWDWAARNGHSGVFRLLHASTCSNNIDSRLEVLTSAAYEATLL